MQMSVAMHEHINLECVGFINGHYSCVQAVLMHKFTACFTHTLINETLGLFVASAIRLHAQKLQNGGKL